MRFQEYITEAKNTHMTHIEDLVLDGGVKGARQAILALRSMRDMLSGNVKAPIDITTKWDGAPALFAGTDPSDGQFFVAKKGIFAKTPKVYKNHDDIDADTSGRNIKELFQSIMSRTDIGREQQIQLWNQMANNMSQINTTVSKNEAYTLLGMQVTNGRDAYNEFYIRQSGMGNRY